MSTDSLSKRAREAAKVASIPCATAEKPTYREGFIEGALWHASHQPSREQIAHAIPKSALGCCVDCPVRHTDADAAQQAEEIADAVIANLTKGAADDVA